ncbi:putative leucine-rich repeat domain superfamily [Helianthus annuus]|nr:putative leucine-rich repeat domain superfamily [Helianthus annuus]KAJ0858069.1 putative leucine-rich repeat domain superfamily [Helianthus annuus]
MYSLQYLDLSGNEFYRHVPEKINDLYGLSYLNFPRNNFTSRFPNGIGKLQQLAVLDLHSSSLWGEFRGVGFLA